MCHFCFGGVLINGNCVVRLTSFVAVNGGERRLVIPDRDRMCTISQSRFMEICAAFCRHKMVLLDLLKCFRQRLLAEEISDKTVEFSEFVVSEAHAAYALEVINR